MISLWSSFFSSYQCFIFRTWKHSLGSLFYNSSKQNTDSHTAAPSEKQRLLKAHSCIPEAAESSLLCGHQSDRDDRFGHESMSMTSVWTWGVSKRKDVKRRSWLSVKQCRQHSSENKRGDTFLFLIESPHMTLHGPETRCTSRSFQHFCNWNDFISFLSATNLSCKSFVLCSPLRRWSETGRTLLFCCFRIV